MKRKTEKMPKMMDRKKAKAAMAPPALLSLADSAWRLRREGGEEEEGRGGGREGRDEMVCVCACMWYGYESEKVGGKGKER